MENAWNVELSGPDRAHRGLRYGSAVPRVKEGPPAVSSCLPRPKTNSSAAAIDNCPFPSAQQCKPPDRCEVRFVHRSHESINRCAWGSRSRYVVCT
jgi:hypothetical protein